jgi:hypothetical protein
MENAEIRKRKCQRKENEKEGIRNRLWEFNWEGGNKNEEMGEKGRGKEVNKEEEMQKKGGIRKRKKMGE